MSSPVRLKDVATRVSLFQRATDPAATADARAAARAELVAIYRPVVVGYVRAKVGRRPGAGDLVDDLSQEVLTRFVEGRYDRAALGRTEERNFRAYFARVLQNIVTDEWRRRRLTPLMDREPAAGGEAVLDELWKAEAFDRVLARLKVGAGGPQTYAILKAGLRYWLSAASPSYAGMAADTAVTAVVPADETDPVGWLRTEFGFARHRFKDELWAEIAGWLADPTEDQIAAEFRALNLSTRVLPTTEVED